MKPPTDASQPLQVNPHIPFISETDLEQRANDLLVQFARAIEPVQSPPVPVEKIADFLLNLNIDWVEIPDTEEEPVLAYIHAQTQTIRLNERRLSHFEQYPGTYEFTLAHEIGHYLLHLTGQEQLYRFRPATWERREWQAEQFASYLLLPSHLLLPAIEGLNLQSWPDLYRLRDRFNVSITALRIRLEKLGYLFVAENGRIYPDEASSMEDRRQAMRRAISQANFYRAAGQPEQAKVAYRQALTLAQNLNDRRSEANCAWSLGLLYAESDPARAVELMSICVAYERETGHPEAEADAQLLAEIAARC
jgi:Zn-dependent peptidase ImmA (M78 family)